MIRRVAFKKAGLAGAAGAIVWDLAARAALLLGLPLFDLVSVLGTLAVGPGNTAFVWWTAGLVLHLIVGAIWAVFYAYFFWSTFNIPPLFQGVLFSLFPAILAGLIMIPQMDLMLEGGAPNLGFFAVGIGWGGPVGVFVGHIIYGIVVGSIYTHPVGYRVGKRVLSHG